MSNLTTYDPGAATDLAPINGAAGECFAPPSPAPLPTGLLRPRTKPPSLTQMFNEYLREPLHMFLIS